MEKEKKGGGERRRRTRMRTEGKLQFRKSTRASLWIQDFKESILKKGPKKENDARIALASGGKDLTKSLQREKEMG